MKLARADVETPPVSAFARTAASVAHWASVGFMVALAALHLLEPGIDPSWHFISEYELGRFGWLMQLAFLLLATSCLALAMAIVSQVRTVGGYLGLASLVVSAVGMVIAGIFITEPPNASRIATTQHGRLHELGAMLDGIPFAALFINWSLARDRAWGEARRLLAWSAPIPLLGLVVFMVALGSQLPPAGTLVGPGNLVGWPNRVMILAHCAWIIPVAWSVRSRR